MTKERSTALQQTGSGGHGHGHGQQQHQQQHHHQRQETPVNNNNNNNYPHGRYHQRTRKPPPAPGAAASLSAADYSPLGPSSASSATGSGSAGGRHLSSAATTEIQCAVHNVFPLPELTIYQVLSDGLRPRSLENARLAQNITKLSNGAYDVSVTAYIEDIELLQQQQQQPKQQQHHQPQPQQQQPKLPMKPTPTIFECLVSQDELRHEIRERTRYTITFGLFWSFFGSILQMPNFVFSTPQMTPTSTLVRPRLCPLVVGIFFSSCWLSRWLSFEARRVAHGSTHQNNCDYFQCLRSTLIILLFARYISWLVGCVQLNNTQRRGQSARQGRDTPPRYC